MHIPSNITFSTFIPSWIQESQKKIQIRDQFSGHTLGKKLIGKDRVLGHTRAKIKHLALESPLTSKSGDGI